MASFLSEHWLEIVIGILGVLGAGFVLRLVIHRQSGSSNYVNQSGVKTQGDVVGRDKITRDDGSSQP